MSRLKTVWVLVSLCCLPLQAAWSQDTAAGNTIRGGTNYETAVPLEFDLAYRLDHHQKIGFFDFFTIDLPANQEFILELQTMKKGINLRGTVPEETDLPYAGAELHGTDHKRIDRVHILGKKNDVEILTHTPKQAGRYYILIGSTYDDIHKDQMQFRVSSIIRGDLFTSEDAGDSLTQAKFMEAKVYTTNYIGAGDQKDVFVFEAKKGETYFIGLIPNEDTGSYFQISVFDSYKQKVFSKSSGINEGLKSKEFTIPADGVYYIEVALGSVIKRPVSYTFELAATSKAAEENVVEAPKAKPKKAKKPKPKPKPEPEPASPKIDLEGEGPRAMPTPTELPEEKPSPTN